MSDSDQMIPVSFEEVFSEFQEMQKAQNEAISEHWIEHARQSNWCKGKVNPLELVVPYSEFRKIVFYSRRGLTNREALQEIMKSNSNEAIRMVTSPFTNPPPIIVWLRPDGKFQVDDGCKRSLTACFLGLPEIDAFICIPKIPEKLDYWKSKPKYEPS